MKPIPFTVLAAALLLPSVAARSEEPPAAARVGDVYELIKSYETSMEGSGGSSASSQGHEMLIERVIAVRSDGLELEYDVPRSESSGAHWQFPARVFRPVGGELQLLNRAELESRVDGWLKKGKMTRAACGRWTFTWNAFRIDCDPQSAIAIVSSYDLGPSDLREGALFRTGEARAPAPLRMKRAGPEGSTYVAEMEIDPDAVRRAQAESDVVVGEILGEPVSLDAATRDRAKDAVSGTISITFETDPAGQVKRRTEVVKLEVRRPDGVVETRTASEVLERRLVSEAAASR
ncbi:MAG TPA: hypothetical protein VEA61_16135 [Allosphingosinicella sp.]|nr:hypothetical protein [Allosphingosinicella sp.]